MVSVHVDIKHADKLTIVEPALKTRLSVRRLVIKGKANPPNSRTICGMIDHARLTRQIGSGVEKPKRKRTFCKIKQEHHHSDVQPVLKYLRFRVNRYCKTGTRTNAPPIEN